MVKNPKYEDIDLSLVYLQCRQAITKVEVEVEEDTLTQDKRFPLKVSLLTEYGIVIVNPAYLQSISKLRTEARTMADGV